MKDMKVPSNKFLLHFWDCIFDDYEFSSLAWESYFSFLTLDICNYSNEHFRHLDLSV
jgi:hypothetical protein